MPAACSTSIVCLSLSRKPARLERGKCTVSLHLVESAVDSFAKEPVVLRNRNPEFLMGRHLQGDRQFGPILDQPRDHRKQLNDEPNAAGFKIVERGSDVVI